MVRPPQKFIIIGHPDLKKGPARLPCGICAEIYPVQVSTFLTAQELGAKSPPIICYFCFTKAQQKVGESAAPTEMVGMKELRKRTGLDPL